MHPRNGNSQSALTLFEVLIVIAILLLTAILILPRLARSRITARRSQCINNLRQVGLEFRAWAMDNDNHFPMSISITNGGTREFGSQGGVYAHFLALSNYLSAPKMLACSEDKTRRQATNFSTGFGEVNISYFVNLDAAAANPLMLLSGDRNITNGTMLPNRILELRSNSKAGWTEKIHELRGNIAFSDGGVREVDTTRFREVLSNAGTFTNRLAMPLDSLQP